MPQPLTSPGVTIISEMITPALFILASGSLLSSALGRLARVVDYFRKLSESPHRPAGGGMLELVEKRINYAEATVALICTGIMLFVSTCLLIVVDRELGHTIYWAPVTSAILGVLLLLVASSLMVAECRMGLRQLRAEIADLRENSER